MLHRLWLTFTCVLALLILAHGANIVPVEVIPDTSAKIIPDTLTFGVNSEFVIPNSELKDSTGAQAIIDTTVTAPPPRPRLRREDIAKLSREEYFALAFGRPAPARPRNLAVRLTVDGMKFGEAEVSYDDEFTAFEFISRPLARHLDTLLLPDERDRLEEICVLSEGRFHSGHLRGLDYEVNLVEDDYSLDVTVPPESKRLQRTQLGRRARELRGDEIPPAALSFYVNARADAGWRSTGYDYNSGYTGRNQDGVVESRDRVIYHFDGAIRAFDIVAEARARVTEPHGGQDLSWSDFRRDDMRLLRDFVPRHIRLTAGDVNDMSGFLGYETMGGARVERNERFFGNDPRDNVDAVTFFMPQAGEVQLFVDGIFDRRFYLPAGFHEISDFGGRTGKNDVRLMVRLNDGSVEEIPFRYVRGEPNNMVTGEYRYAFGAGMRRYAAPGTPGYYAYSFREPGVTAEFFYGLHYMVTAGAMARASEYNRVGGVEMLFGLDSLGTVTLMGAVNDNDTLGPGWRAELNYTVYLRRAFIKLAAPSALPLPLRNMRLTLKGYAQSECYTPYIFTGYYRQPVRGGASGALDFGLPMWNVTLDGEMTFNRSLYPLVWQSPENYRSGARVTRRFPKGSVTAGAGINITGGELCPFFNLNGNYTFGIERHRIRLSGRSNYRAYYARPVISGIDAPYPGGPLYDTSGGHVDYNLNSQADARWNWSGKTPSNNIGAQSYRANFTQRDDGMAAQARAAQSRNRFDITADYRYNLREYEAYTTEQNRVTANAGASFMYAGGLWAVGRPTTGNFILIDTRDNLKGSTVHIGRSARHEFSRSGLLGAAYHNRGSEYYPSEVNIRLSDAPPGAWIDEHRYYAKGTYKQGYALKLGREAQAFALVKILDGGKPLAYTFVTVENAAPGAKAYRLDTFTNGLGVLQMGDLTPGQAYRIKFNAATFIKDIIVEIPLEMEDDVVELSDVEVEKE